ncbi:MAG: hypothetical protein KDK78_00720 [Chlamydiia bacterium]|nr:hypothetical protein [Chlamydiia bacterium]
MQATHTASTSIASYALRGALFAAGPVGLAYLGGPMAAWRQGGWMVRGLMAAAAPSVFLCSAGLVEGAARTAFAALNGCYAHLTQNPHMEEGARRTCALEAKRTHALMRGALFPLDGYALAGMNIALMRDVRNDEWQLAGRSLIDDYILYNGAYVTCKHSYKAGRWVVVKTTDAGWRATKFTAKKVHKTLDAVGFYTACRVTAEAAGILIAAGCGLAVAAFEVARPKSR